MLVFQPRVIRSAAKHLLLFAAFVATAHALDSVPKPEYHARRVALAKSLQGGAALLFAATEPVLDFMPYRQDSDFYYLTGSTEPGAALLVIADGPATTVPRLGIAVPAHPYREILFMPERNLVMEKYTGTKLDAATASAATIAGVDEVRQMRELPDVLASYVAEDRRRANNFYTQTDFEAPKATFSFLAATLGVESLPAARDVRTLTSQLREVKSPAEIELLKKAANASAAGQLAGMRAIKPGLNERVVAAVENLSWAQQGCERPSYAPIVGSGINSTTLHYSSNERTMQKGDVVVIDAGCEYSMYAADITRTMPVDHKFTPRQREIYDIVLGAQQAAAAAFVAGKMRLGNVNQRGDSVTDSIDKVAYDYINTHGKDLHGEPLGKYFLHGLGHHVGIDVHDPYDATKPLVVGNVFTIEPGIYIPEEKIGVRIEDTFYVGTDGRLVNLSANLPHRAEDVEAVMK